MQKFEHGGDVYAGDAPEIDFSINTNPLGMPPAAVEAVRARTDEDVRYPDPRCRALTAALERRFSLPHGQVLCGSGSADLLFRLCAVLRPRDTLVTAPTFSEYARSALLCGGTVREYPLREADGWLAGEGFLSAITRETDLVCVCNPNNPTGRLFPEKWVAAVADRCEETGSVLLLDECFLPFTEGRSALEMLDTHPRLLILRAFTKIYSMAGLRLGVLLGSDTALLAEIARFGAAWSVSTVAQRAGLAALGDESWIGRTRALVGAQRDLLTAALSAMGLTVYPADGNFLLVKAPFDVDPPLRARGLWVRRCENFTGLDARYFRIGIRLPEENAVLIDALREVLHG